MMFVGASPGGTGGGIKTTAKAVVVLSMISYVKGEQEPVVSGRNLSREHIQRVTVIMAFFFTYIASVNLLIDRIEEKDFLYTLC